MTTTVIPLRDYLTPGDLVQLLDQAVTESTLRNWRSDRRGPRFITIGRRVLYAPEAVQEWFDEVHANADARWEDRG